MPELGCDCILLRCLFVSHTTGFILISSTSTFYNELARLGKRTLNFVALKQHDALVCHFLPLQSNLRSLTPRIMHSSVYEQIFWTQSVSDDVLCLELWTHKPSTSWSDKVGESPSKQHSTSSQPSTYAVNSPPNKYGKTKLSFRVYLICLVFCDRFNGFHWFCVKNLCTKYCCKSLNKQPSGVQERINPFYINSYGENSFGLRTTFRSELSSWTDVWLHCFVCSKLWYMPTYQVLGKNRCALTSRNLTVLNTFL